MQLLPALMPFLLLDHPQPTPLPAPPSPLSLSLNLMPFIEHSSVLFVALSALNPTTF